MKKTSTMKKRNRSNYKPGKGTVIKGKSMTIQDDAVSIATLLKRHLAGESLTQRAGVFVPDADEDDIDGMEFARMDLTEREDVLAGIRAMTQRLKAMEKEMAEAKKATPKTEPKEGS